MRAACTHSTADCCRCIRFASDMPYRFRPCCSEYAARTAESCAALLATSTSLSTLSSTLSSRASPATDSGMPALADENDCPRIGSCSRALLVLEPMGARYCPPFALEDVLGGREAAVEAVVMPPVVTALARPTLIRSAGTLERPAAEEAAVAGGRPPLADFPDLPDFPALPPAAPPLPLTVLQADAPLPPCLRLLPIPAPLRPLLRAAADPAAVGGAPAPAPFHASVPAFPARVGSDGAAGPAPATSIAPAPAPSFAPTTVAALADAATLYPAGTMRSPISGTSPCADPALAGLLLALLPLPPPLPPPDGDSRSTPVPKGGPLVSGLPSTISISSSVPVSASPRPLHSAARLCSF